MDEEQLRDELRTLLGDEAGHDVDGSVTPSPSPATEDGGEPSRSWNRWTATLEHRVAAVEEVLRSLDESVQMLARREASTAVAELAARVEGAVRSLDGVVRDVAARSLSDEEADRIAHLVARRVVGSTDAAGLRRDDPRVAHEELLRQISIRLVEHGSRLLDELMRTMLPRLPDAETVSAISVTVGAQGDLFDQQLDRLEALLDHHRMKMEAIVRTAIINGLAVEAAQAEEGRSA